MELSYYRTFWRLDEKACPCDIHFMEYLAREGVRGKAVFHFGTGYHHTVGLRNLELDSPNDVLAVTASREEHDIYVHSIIQNPRLALHYKVLFADIYTLTPALLPRFDAVTLFHLCEYYSKYNAAYTRFDDRSVIRMFAGLLNPGGRLLLYRRSCAYEAARPIAEEVVREGLLAKVTDFKTLEVFRKP